MKVLLVLFVSLCVLHSTFGIGCRPKVGDPCGHYPCCQGMTCHYDDPDAQSGRCIESEIPTCASSGKMCSGIAAIQCCEGLKCVKSGPSHPDQSGVCN